jgi:queuine tRNA-ribosyltransferase
VRARELTAVRLLTLHNLTFMALLMRGLRNAIEEDRYAQHAAAVLAGEQPYA